MISEWFFNMVAGIAEFLVGLLPDWQMPAGIADPGGMVEGIVSAGTGMGAWVDWVAVAAIGAIPMAVWVIGLIWKAFRTGFSHTPLIGGSG